MRAFYTLLAGQITSTFGTRLTGFALGVWMYQVTGSVTRYGAIVLSLMLPPILLSPVAGLLTDRWDRRRTLILSQAGGGACAILLALAYALGVLNLGVIVSLLAAKTSFEALEAPAFSACTKILVPPEHFGRVNGLGQLGLGLALVVSPTAAMTLSPLIGLGGVLLLDTATFVVALALLLAVRVPHPEGGAAKAPERRWRREAMAGFAYLRRRGALGALIVLVALVNFNMGTINLLFAPLVLNLADAKAYGLVQSIGGVGFLVGSSALAVWGGPRRPADGVLAFTFLQGMILLVAVIKPSLYLAGVGSFGFLLSFPFVIGCSQTIWQREVPLDLQGRVLAVRAMTSNAAFSLASLIGGPLTDRVFEPAMKPGGALAGSIGVLMGTGPGRGAALLIACLGLLTATAAVVAWLSRPALRELGADAEAPEVERLGPA
jgi:DHA3 family macrolide efflux protein-like MFS transporter